jgi:hypothetical protein
MRLKGTCHRFTDRQMDGHTDRQIDGRTDRQMRLAVSTFRPNDNIPSLAGAFITACQLLTKNLSFFSSNMMMTLSANLSVIGATQLVIPLTQ